MIDELSPKGLVFSTEASGYRHSMDPYLLANFVSLAPESRAIDLGSGDGVLAILIARLFADARMVGLELQGRLANLARDNVLRNGLGERVKIVQGDIRLAHDLFDRGSFDHVLGNPPYRSAQGGRVNPDPEKAVARHEIAITLAQYLQSSAYLLRRGGRLWLIYSALRLDELLGLMWENSIAPKRLRTVHPRPDAEAKMVLLEGLKGGRKGLKVMAPLIVHRADGGYTEELAQFYAAI